MFFIPCDNWKTLFFIQFYKNFIQIQKLKSSLEAIFINIYFSNFYDTILYKCCNVYEDHIEFDTEQIENIKSAEKQNN